MFQRITLLLLMLTALIVNAQTINLHGKVSTRTGQLISNAIVTLVNQGLKDTTGAEGAYSIASTAVVMPTALVPRFKTIVLEKGVLEFSLTDPSQMKVEIFDIKGNLLKRELLQNASKGFYRFNIEENSRGSQLLIIRTSINQDVFTFRYLPFKGLYLVSQSNKSSKSVGGILVKIAAISDSLKVTATGFLTKAVAVTSYEQEVNITLDSANAKRSSGCGKTTTLHGEQIMSISSGGQNREYIVRLPADYDPNTAYKLWFSLHCAAGTDTGVAKGSTLERGASAYTNYEYYGVWKFANPTAGKGTTIFCAPQGVNKLWSNTNESDVEFIRALVKKFSNELCIDMSRIFSEGFSMGGAMSYTLACAMPDTFKAVCMHEGGGLPMCTKVYRGPVGMFITHATDDSWPGAGAPQLKDLAQQNSCTPMDVPSMITPAPDLMHPVCVEYKNCEEGFPCRACIFKGGHTPSPGTEGPWGEANTWVDDSTWSFFKRFY